MTGGRRRAGRGASVRPPRGGAGSAAREPDPLGSPGKSPRASGGGESGCPAGWRVTGLRGAAREDPSGNHEVRAATGDPRPHRGPRRPVFRPAARDCQRPDPSELARAAGPAARRASSRARPGSRRRHRRPRCPRSRRVGPAHCAAAARCSRPRRLHLAGSPRGARPRRPGPCKRLGRGGEQRGVGLRGSGRPGVRGGGGGRFSGGRSLTDRALRS